MAVTEFTIQPDGDCKVSIEGGRVVTTYHYIYTAISDDHENDDQHTIVHDPVMPLVGLSTLTVNPLAVCRSKGPARRKNRNGAVWEVPTEWSTNTPDTSDGQENEGDQPDDPEDMAPEVVWGGETIYVETFRDKDGEAIRNSFGDPLPDAVEIPLVIPTVTVTRYERTSPKPAIANYTNKVNSVTWNDFPARSVQMGVISSVLRRVNNVPVWQTTYPFKVSGFPWGWDKSFLDRGYRWNNGGSDFYFGSPGAPTIGLLDGSGGHARGGVGDQGQEGTQEEVFIRKKIMREIDFNQLGIVV